LNVVAGFGIGWGVRCASALLFLVLGAGVPAWAQATAPAPAPPANIFFSGSGPGETTAFTTQDRWQVRWAGAPSSVTIEDPRGDVVAGAGGATGTLYLPTGGTYKVRVVPTGNPSGGWRIEISQVAGPGQAVRAEVASAYVPPDMTFGGAAPAPSIPAPVADSAASGFPLASLPPSAGVHYATPSGQPKLSDSQTAAMVIIRGDVAEGTGFLVRTAAGSFVITNQHVIGANPHLKITTTSGDDVQILGLQAASDRDLALIPVQDNNYTYLQVADSMAGNVQVGDAVITPGNSQGGGTMLTSVGTVVALGPQKVEFNNPVYHGNSGGPIIEVKSGKVIGVVTEGMTVTIDNDIDKASFENHNSPIKSSVRYFGMRLDNVPSWMTVPWGRFESETTFLENFHVRSVALDSFMNSTHDNSEFGSAYRRDDKVRDMADDYRAKKDDTAHMVDNVRQLIFDIGDLADTDLADMQNPVNFYPFDQERAKQEVAYREALKKEIDGASSNVDRLTDIGRSF
jgi:hypothetical protein